METMHLINQTEELQKYVRINISVLRESFLPFEYDAQEKFLLPYLGENLISELRLLANTSDYPVWADTPKKKIIADLLLEKSKRCLAKFTIYLATPHMDLHLSEMGFVVTHTGNSAPASSQRVSAAKDALLHGGYDNLETLLKILEDNHNDIASYTDSEAYLFAFDNLINSSSEFNSFLQIGRSRLHFLSIKHELDNTKELTIAPVASPELLQEIIQQKKNKSLSEPNKKVLPVIQKAMVHLATANTLTAKTAACYLNPSSNNPEPVSELTLAETKQRLKTLGYTFLAEVKNILLKNPESYPAYLNSSTYLNLEKTKPYENSDVPLFIFGHPSFKY